MSITLNPAGLIVVGTGVAGISYINGASVTSTPVTGTGVICTSADVSPFADQSKITANGTILGYMSKNKGTTYNLKCFIIGGGGAILANPPDINTMIKFDFHVSGTYNQSTGAFTAGSGDIEGIVTASKVSIAGDAAILDVTIDVVLGLTSGSTPPLANGP